MFHVIRNLAAFISLFFIIISGVFAQQTRELRVGITVNGNLRAEEEVWYSVRPSTTGLLVVETSGDKDTYLELYDSSYNFITSDDDGGENYNARISFLSEVGRTYLYKLRFLSGGESGPYSIRANMGVITELRQDAWVSRNFSGGENHWFNIIPSGAGLLIVETSGDIDTYLDVYNSSSVHIAGDDDGGENLNARVSILVEAGKTYLIRSRCIGGAGFGPYRIRAVMGSISELRPDTRVSGNINNNEERWFSVRPSATGPFMVEVSGNLNAYLEAYDSSNGKIAENANRLEFIAEAGKTYFIKLHDSYETGGSYNIRAGSASVAELRIGSWVSGNIQGSESRWFNIRTSAAGVMIVETSGNTDTYLRAYNSSGNLIMEDDDSGPDYNARMEIFAEANSVYIVQLTQLGGENSPYRVLASFETIPADAGNTTRARAVPLRPGTPVQVFFISQNESRWFRYDASARTMFTVNTSGNMDTVLVLYDAQGRPIAENDDYDGNNNAYISETINPGTVYIEVRLFAGQTGRTTLNTEAWQRQ